MSDPRYIGTWTVEEDSIIRMAARFELHQDRKRERRISRAVTRMSRLEGKEGVFLKWYEKWFGSAA